MTWIEVADSAVKIGLGALISGIATYLLAGLNHKNAVAKDITARKISILEEISELAEAYFYFCTKLNNRVGGILKAATNAGQPQTEGQRKAIQELHEPFTDVLEKRNKALAKLHLLQLDGGITALISHNDVLSQYRDIVVFGQKMPTEPERQAFTEQFLRHRTEFYKALSGYLASLK